MVRSGERKVWTSRNGREYEVVFGRYVLIPTGRGGKSCWFDLRTGRFSAFPVEGIVRAEAERAELGRRVWSPRRVGSGI